MTDQTVPIIINLVAAVFGAFGQYFYKLGAARLKEVPIYLNWQIGLGMFVFCIVMVLMITGFKLGGRLNIVYPVYATTFIWGTLIGIFIEHEPWKPAQLLGIVAVVIGVSVVAIFSKPA